MSAASPESNLSQAAGRWWRMTNNLVASAIIVVVCVVVGREVIHSWWQMRAPQAPTAAEPLASLPPITGPLLTEPFSGSTDEAITALASRCRLACTVRPLVAVGQLNEAALDGSRRLDNDDEFEVHLAEGEPPLLAAVGKVAVAGLRPVYCWGLAMPADESDSPQAWQLSITAPGHTPAQER